MLKWINTKWLKVGKIFALLTLILVLQACATETTNPDTKNNVPTELNIGFVGGKNKYPTGAEGWGLKTGIIQEELKKHGITKVNVTPFLTGPDLNEALISGRIDVGNSGDTPAIIARAAGADTKLISQPTIKMGSLILGKKNGPKTVKDLEGKKIAVVKGSLMHRYLVGVLEEENVNAEIININDTSDQLAALSREEVDAIAGVSYMYNVYQFIQDGYPVLDDNSKYPDLYATFAVVGSQKLLDQFPHFPEVWNVAVEKSLQDLKNNPDDYYNFIAENTATPVEVVPKLYPIENISDTSITTEGIKRANLAKDFLIKQNLAANDFDINTWIIK